MTARNDAKKLTRWLGLGTPPPINETDANLAQPEHAPQKGGRKAKLGKTVQMTLRVPPAVRDCVRMHAARHGVEMSMIIVEAMQLYEEKHGAVRIEAVRPSSSGGES